jgi:hypothetical protein
MVIIKHYINLYINRIIIGLKSLLNKYKTIIVFVVWIVIFINLFFYMEKDVIIIRCLIFIIILILIWVYRQIYSYIENYEFKINQIYI